MKAPNIIDTNYNYIARRNDGQQIRNSSFVPFYQYFFYEKVQFYRNSRFFYLLANQLTAKWQKEKHHDFVMLCTGGSLLAIIFSAVRIFFLESFEYLIRLFF